jgi:adenylate kinase family enzyme
MNPESLKRVVIAGTSCSGKTTLARNVSEILKIKHVELDSLYWLPEWAPRPREEFKMIVEQEISGENWIIDGNYSYIRPLIWARATTLVWLNYSFFVTFSRALKRTSSRVIDKQIICNGNQETFGKAFMSRDSILLWVLQSYWRKRRQYPELIKQPENRHLQIFIFRKPSETNDFLSQLKAIKGRI